MVGLPFGHHSTTLLSFSGGSGFLHKHSRLQSSSLPPVPSGCLLTANRSPLPGSALQTPHFRTQPLCAMVDTLSGLGSRAVVSTICRSLTLSCLPLTGAAFSSHKRMRLPSVPVSSPKGCRSHPTFSPLPFPSFSLVPPG